MRRISHRSGRSQKNGQSMNCKFIFIDVIYENVTISSSSKEYTSQRGYREKDQRDNSRGGGKGRDDRYNRNRSYKEADDRYGGNKHSRANSRWPHESYPASTSSGHHKRHDGNF